MNKFKDYKKCINFLFSLERSGIKYSLKNIRTLLKAIGNPEKKLKAIHIAGTNGKGSVASIINSILIEYGYKCGLYTSPHINDFRERILINGNLIDKYYIIDFTNYMLELIESISPSFFEVTTALAFKYFEENKVNFAIIETGLGGRLDSTNVLNPILTIITGISIDHTEYLGNTIEKIASEKSGIIKRKTPLILGNIKNKKAKEIITKVAEYQKAEIINSTKECRVKIKKRTENGFYFYLRNENFILEEAFLPLVGDFQRWNLATSFSAIKKLFNIYDIKIDYEKILTGLKNLKSNSKFYGRFEKIKENPKIVIDVSHNSEGIKNIKNSLKYFDYNKLIIIFGIMSDKKYETCFRELEKLNSTIILTKPTYKRALDPRILIRSAKEKNKIKITENVKDAFDFATKFADKKDLILITGSFFLISDFLKVLKNKYN